ncbi:CGRE1 protein, partial [Polypterus senegalus]
MIPVFSGKVYVLFLNIFLSRLLQSYIQSRFSEGHGNPDKMTWEQEVFSIFSLHDYDKSGQMDGLELMKMLSDFLSHHYMPQTSAESVGFIFQLWKVKLVF